MEVNCICIDCGTNFTYIPEKKLSKKPERCPVCKKKRRSLQVMLSRKKKIPETEIGCGSGNSYKNKHQPLGIQTYRRAKGTECAWCGSTKSLLVHHLDENRYNNELSNLVTICKRCHQQHHTVRNMTTGRYEAKKNPGKNLEG